MNDKWRILITSGPLDKDYLEAEVWCEDEQWILLSEFGKTIKFYPKQSGEPWSFDFEDVLAIFNRLAKEKLDLSGLLDDVSD